MALATRYDEPRSADPVLLLALSGWVDAASVGTDAADHIAAGGDLLASFDRDALFDYRANRPVLSFRDGRLEDITWPALEVRRVRHDTVEVLVMSGNEPDFRWDALGTEVADLARGWQVRKLVTLGAVPAAYPHTLPPPVLTTASDDALVLNDDLQLSGTLVVPGAAVSILTEALIGAGIPSVGYWAQVPHYLSRPYHAGVLALVNRVAAQIGVTLPVDDLAVAASQQTADLDARLAANPEAQAFLSRLEDVAAAGSLPSADEIGAEVERFLRESGDDNPFRDQP
jgi:hypothetical protein